ncbi:unnamed protein product [Diatraea saccharalis]|uniref:Galectin n=1 Tax=Diatraea saccharalis TaxID=40085 RepID=A0A9N9RCY7_9NEOP|nr:unnamed protein product [Diatraea saccharalis]
MKNRDTKEQLDNELVYQPRLNGDSERAPPWPEPQYENEIMFVLPRKPSVGDRITIGGILKTNPNSMSVNLLTGNISPDYQNIACKFEALFPNNANNTDKIILKVVQNGIEEIIQSDEDITATDLFTDSNFSFVISIGLVNTNFDSIPAADIYIGGSSLAKVPLKHNLNSVKFLMLNGDIERVNTLDFQFS